jgi:hypothetical protein
MKEEPLKVNVSITKEIKWENAVERWIVRIDDWLFHVPEELGDIYPRKALCHGKTSERPDESLELKAGDIEYSCRKDARFGCIWNIFQSQADVALGKEYPFSARFSQLRVASN